MKDGSPTSSSAMESSSKRIKEKPVQSTWDRFKNGRNRFFGRSWSNSSRMTFSTWTRRDFFGNCSPTRLWRSKVSFQNVFNCFQLIFRREVHWRQEKQGAHHRPRGSKHVGLGKTSTSGNRSVEEPAMLQERQDPAGLHRQCQSVDDRLVLSWFFSGFIACLGVIFEEWLKKWDKKLKKDGRKVLLYVDNCSAHPQNLVLECITVKFFPPNTTAMSQVCVFFSF